MGVLKQLFGLRKISAACASNVGKVREKNEDNYCFDGSIMRDKTEDPYNVMAKEFEQYYFAEQGEIFAVFDGMGGAQYGELASHDAAESTSSFMRNPNNINPNDITPTLLNLCNTVNKKVFEAGANLGVTYMGTTMAALYFYNNKVWSCNIGDSRCYRLRRGVLEMLSEDHVEEMYNIDKAERKKKPGLIQYLGMDPEEIRLEPTIKCERVERGDMFLICSDGLTDMVPEQDIAKVLNIESTTKDTVKALIKTAIENGGRDNITAIVCQFR